MSSTVADRKADFGVGDWLWHPDAGAAKVVDCQSRWGRTTLRIWSPSSDKIFHVDAGEVRPVAGEVPSIQTILHRAAAAKIKDALADDLLLAPIRSSVTPLPHQLYALERAMSSKQVRYLFADEVGLGKTIEAGLVIRELKLRGIAKRVLVIAPKGLTAQWQSEMLLHFNESFSIADPADLEAIGRWSGVDNAWRTSKQVICPLDSVKPLAKRRGWSPERIAAYNRQRFEDLITAGWDLVIVDEAHRLGGSSDEVARYKLGVAMADASPHLLLLSATPHSGKTDQFLRLMQLLDREAFPDETSVTRDRVAPYVVRTEKRVAIDNEGKPLFKPRQTRLIGVEWEDRHRPQQLLYEAVTEYVRHGYNQARKNKQRHIGFLMVLMQRLVTSSTAAIAATLRRRLEALELPEAQLSLIPEFDFGEVADLDGQAQLEELIDWPGWRSEKAEVEALIRLAENAISTPDAKVEALLELIYRIQQEESDPQLKVLIFTEFIPTQAMLAEHLHARGFSVATLNGHMPLDERLKAQQEFAQDARILISTDAGGEGLNLQFAHVVVNFDMPWNPMRIEQRIGRVDRIGQKHIVRALNLVLAETVEYRVRDVLEQKLAAIAEEFGIDKAADVMDSADAEVIFDGVYLDSISDGDVERHADETLAALRERIVAERHQRELLSSTSSLDPAAADKWRHHPVHFWLERAVVNGVREARGEAEERANGWFIKWPDGDVTERACFDVSTAEAHPDRRWITLEDPKARALVEEIGVMLPQQPRPHLSIKGLPAGVCGTWSLWQVEVETPREKLRRFIPIFTQNGRVFAPTARRIWDLLVASSEVAAPDGHVAANDVADLEMLAAEQAEPIYLELRNRHLADLNIEKERVENAFQARLRAIGRIGLENVRRSRRSRLERDHQERLRELAAAERSLPSLNMVIAVDVEATA